MRLLPIAITAALFIGACTESGQPLNTTPVSITLSPALQARTISYDRVVLRSMQPGPDGKPVELAGAKCTLKSSDLSAELVTPAAVNLPRVKGQPGPITVTCRAAGKSGSKQIPPRLVRAQGSAPAGGGLAGALIMAAAAGAMSGIADRWSYAQNGGDLRIELK